MSKRAEEKALEIFPVKKVPYYGLACNAYSERDANFDKRALFCMGYSQAEKDLAPTWQDIELIVNIDKDTNNEEALHGPVRNNEEHHEEVLRRFNEVKAQKK